MANQYEIAVIGGGPAGCMAAIRSARGNKDVALIERNPSLGRKLLLTGNGRCNLTNSSPMDVFMKNFGSSGNFLRSAFHVFSNESLMHFFASCGLKLKTESHDRVFPVTDKSSSVLAILEKCLRENNVNIIYNTRIIDIKKKEGVFSLAAQNGISIKAKKIIIATGGASYKKTGSTGDGFLIAHSLGHAIISLVPALVSLKAKESWIGDLQGVSLDNIRIIFYRNNKKFVSDNGEIIFTHFGISGPLVLDMSSCIISALGMHKDIEIVIDLSPGLNKEDLNKYMIDKITTAGSVHIKNIIQDMLPKRMTEVFLSLLKISPKKCANQISKKERVSIIDMLKAFPLTVTGSLPIDEAMATEGGISRKEINPRTMESRLIPGLYFAGEAIEGRGTSGGYNLQQAFSTGYLAGECAGQKAT
ncbi:MAG: NAD(P)/FAD-dependent oxidoreductase [Candidatus Omnitrophica bacterium]|nr:NAD(P)/FAD-dependent oxidoreductase [Candidatus Omnitrophota bacterium]